MGFFLEDKTVELMTAKPVRAPRQASKAVSAAPGCDGCILRPTWPQLHNPRMQPMAGLEPEVMFIGAVPSFGADRAGMPLSNTELKLLRKAVPGMHWDRITFNNAAHCHTLQPPAGPVRSCAPYLEDDIAAHPYKALVGLGDTVLRRLVPDFNNKSSARDLAGTWLPVKVNGNIHWYYQLIGLDMLEQFGHDNGPAWPVFRADIKKLFKEVDKLPAPQMLDLEQHTVHIAHTLQEAQDLRARMGPVLAWDVETSNSRKQVPQPTERESLMLTAAFSDGETSFAFSVEHPLERNEWAKPFIKEALDSCEYWVAHNAGYELVWAVERCGIAVDPTRFHDTMAIARRRHDHENLIALANQTRIVLGQNVKHLSDLDVKNLIAYPLPEVLRYNGLDAYSTKLVFDRTGTPAMLQDPNYMRLNHATAMTAQMQLYGLPVNLRRSEELKTKWLAKALQAEDTASKLYEVREWQRSTQKEWRITSDQDTADALVKHGRVELPKTDAQNYKTDEPTLLRCAPDNPLVKCVLDYREANKLTSTYIDPVIAACHTHKDGQPHPCYTVLITATERLSSEDFNIQNFPRRFNLELRKQVEVPPGHVMFAFDYGQLEARLIAMASKDKYFIGSVLNGSDIHADWGPLIGEYYPPFWDWVAGIAQSDDEKKIRKVMRDQIKNKFVFPSFYGSWPKSIAINLDVPEHIIDKVHADFWGKFSGVKAWMKARRQEYADTGSIRTLTGWTRHGIMKGNEPFNTPIQATGANIVADAMNEMAALARAEQDPYLHPRIQIHDDLTFILPEDERLEVYVDRIFRVLAKCRYSWQTLPLLVEAKAGYNWAELEEVATFTGDYVR